MNEQSMLHDHLSELTLERIAAGEIQAPALEEHLSTCSICQARLQAIRDHEAAYRPPPLQRERPSNRRSWMVPAMAMSAAAALLLVIGQQSITSTPSQAPESVYPEDTFRLKGGLNIEFFIKRGVHVQKLKGGDVIHPGERLGFRTSSTTSGHLMIVGVDGRREPYLCFPQRNQGRSSPISPSRELVTLDEAVVFDDLLGQEDIVAIFCDTEFSYADVRDGLIMERKTEAAAFKPGCRLRTIQLRKEKALP